MPSTTLPPIPGSPGIVSPPVLETERVANPANPNLSELTGLPVAPLTGKTPAPDDALADLPPPVAPESGDTVGNAPAITLPEITAEATPSTPLPAPQGGLVPPPLALPGATSLPPAPTVPSLTAQPKPAQTAETVTPLFGPGNVSAEAPSKTKTWKTTLKPVSTAYNTTFNYRRAQLPGAIYRTQYDRENSHLPTRMTREDYVKLLFESAATNNIDGTRALINAGADMNATNPRGETPLSVARRFGAVDTAALLQARGAR